MYVSLHTGFSSIVVETYQILEENGERKLKRSNNLQTHILYVYNEVTNTTIKQVVKLDDVKCIYFNNINTTMTSNVRSKAQFVSDWERTPFMSNFYIRTGMNVLA